MVLRAVLGILSIISVFFLPWWFVFLIALALLFYFEKFYEVVVIALFADVLYGSEHFISFPYSITFISIIFLYIVTKFKKNLIAY